MELNKELVKNCKDAGITLEELCYLRAKVLEEDWGIDLGMGSIAKLKALGYLDFHTERVTAPVFDLVTEEIVEHEKFSEFWEMYPFKDTETGRVIRSKRDACVREFGRCVKKDGWERILEGTRSYLEMQNSYKYVKSPLGFLENHMYLDYTGIRSNTTSYGEGLA